MFLVLLVLVWLELSDFLFPSFMQLETVFSVNVLQFIFLSLRLDRVILWSWVVSVNWPLSGMEISGVRVFINRLEISFVFSGKIFLQFEKT